MVVVVAAVLVVLVVAAAASVVPMAVVVVMVVAAVVVPMAETARYRHLLSCSQYLFTASGLIVEKKLPSFSKDHSFPLNYTTVVIK
jgi:hypothetical protein